VVQADARLLEALASQRRVAGFDADRRPAADAVKSLPPPQYERAIGDAVAISRYTFARCRTYEGCSSRVGFPPFVTPPPMLGSACNKKSVPGLGR
jgi:hypothetical protein